MTVQPGSGGICGTTTSKANSAYSANAYYWNSRDETLEKTWFSQFSKLHPSPWDLIGDDD